MLSQLAPKTLFTSNPPHGPSLGFSSKTQLDFGVRANDINYCSFQYAVLIDTKDKMIPGVAATPANTLSISPRILPAVKAAAVVT